MQGTSSFPPQINLQSEVMGASSDDSVCKALGVTSFDSSMVLHAWRLGVGYAHETYEFMNIFLDSMEGWHLRLRTIGHSLYSAQTMPTEESS